MKFFAVGVNISSYPLVELCVWILQVSDIFSLAGYWANDLLAYYYKHVEFYRCHFPELYPIFTHFIMSLFQFIGNPCGHHGSYTFYKAFKFNQGNNCRILTLGEFFFVKIFSEAPVCISELQLLWEDKNNSQLLSSVRLYYLPEHTPDGKQEFHGQVNISFFHFWTF